MSQSIIRVAVTGGAGQIAYNLLFRIASGEMFGAEQAIALHILEVPAAMDALKGVKMELDDCAFPLLKELRIGSDPREVFDGIHYALLVGAKPRGPGMERADLLHENRKIFIAQGQALNDVASEGVKVLVVGNPCNTNALIAMHQAPKIPKTNFFSMTRLDQNRAMAQLANKAGVPVEAVKKMAIWGNHSATQVPDYYHATINGKAASALITDQGWLKSEFMETVQKRGVAIIQARGKSSAASAANAIIDTIQALNSVTPSDDWFSLGVYSEGNPYGIDSNLNFSFPCRSDGKGNISIVEGIEWDAFLKEKIEATEKELIEERETAMATI